MGVEIVVDDREDDEMDESLEPDDGDEDEGEEDDEGSDYQQRLQDQQEQIAKLEAAARRNNRENAKHRHELRDLLKRHGVKTVAELDAKLNPPETPADQGQAPEGIVEGSGSPTEPPETPGTGVKPPITVDEAEVARRVAREVERRVTETEERNSVLEEALRTASIESALKSEQFSGTLERALRVLDIDSIEVGADGKVTGLEQAVADLKSEFPEWFRRRPEQGQARRRDARDVDGGEKPKVRQRPPTWDQAVAAQLERR